MQRKTLLKAVLFHSIILLVLLSSGAFAQQARRGGIGMFGDWKFKVEYEGRQMESILSFSRDAEGNRTASLISFWGVSELKDLKFENGELSFVQSNRFGDQEFTQTFNGKIEEGKLTGMMKGDRGEFKVTGERMPRMSRAVGVWELTLKMGEREFNSKLIVDVNKEGELTGKWESQRGESQVSDLVYERGTLTFKRTSTYQGNERQSTFEGAIDRQTGMLTGTMKSERGEIAVEGKRLGVDLIGTWNLETTSERGTRKQRLTVYPNMTGLYGAMPIKKIELTEGKVTFMIVMQFGENKFEMNFEGKIEEGKFLGEMKTSRGANKVTGTKVVRRFVRQRPSANN